MTLCTRQATADTGCLPQETLKTPDSGSVSWRPLLLSPRSWCMQGFVCVLQESLFHPVLWKFYNQIPLTFKVRFPGDSQSLCQIPRLGSLMWGLELHKSVRTSLALLLSSLCVAHLVGMGFDLNVIVPLLTSPCSFSLVLWHGVFFFFFLVGSNILLSKSRWNWKTGKPGVLQFMGLQRVGHNSVT